MEKHRVSTWPERSSGSPALWRWSCWAAFPHQVQGTLGGGARGGTKAAYTVHLVLRLWPRPSIHTRSPGRFPSVSWLKGQDPVWLCAVFHHTQVLARLGLWRHARPPRGGEVAQNHSGEGKSFQWEKLQVAHLILYFAWKEKGQTCGSEKSMRGDWPRGRSRPGGDQRVDEMQIWSRTCAQIPGTVQNMRALCLSDQCTGRLHPSASLPRPRAAPRGSCTGGGWWKCCGFGTTGSSHWRDLGPLSLGIQPGHPFKIALGSSWEGEATDRALRGQQGLY